ncbi:hypothetical protein Tco_0991157 [Tanacetum coccineum]|uniref:Uncharacterized protein n=1 Tax=Tanacetum coccineum TaxID=301880 RepID=A0ABQ5EZ90_9ASTR
MDNMPSTITNTYVLERFNTTAGNPVKKILLKLNLYDHRSILTDSKMVGGEFQEDCNIKAFQVTQLMNGNEPMSSRSPPKSTRRHSSKWQEIVALVDRLKMPQDTMSNTSSRTSQSKSHSITTTSILLSQQVNEVTNPLTHGGLLRWRVAQEASCFTLSSELLTNGLNRTISMERSQDVLLKELRVLVQQVPVRARVLQDLSPEEKEREFFNKNLIEIIQLTSLSLNRTNHIPQTNHQLRMSSNARNNAWVQDVKVVFQDVHGDTMRINKEDHLRETMRKRTWCSWECRSVQKRGGIINPGQAKPCKCYHLPDEEQLVVILPGEQVTNFNEDVDDSTERLATHCGS